MTQQNSLVRKLARERAIAVRALRQIVSRRLEPGDLPSFNPRFIQDIAIKALEDMGEYHA